VSGDGTGDTVPWCDDCERYWAPSAMTPEGRCPTCDADLEAPARVGGGDGEESTEDEKAPWHFKLLIVALVVYLVYRGYEMFFA
jgi:hypothetical protein